jgi:hypothetical protein
MAVQNYGCLSSYLMAALIDFRNLEGTQADWTYENPDPADVPFSFQVKKITAELGACLIGVVALIETVVYGILYIISSPVVVGCALMGYERPIRFLLGTCVSSLTTIKWVKTILHKNLTEYNIESDKPLSILIDSNPELISLVNRTQNLKIQNGILRQMIKLLRLTISQPNNQRLRARIDRLQNTLDRLTPPSSQNLAQNNENLAQAFIHRFMELPQSTGLKADMLNEFSTEACQLFLFLAVKELLLSDWDESRLPWFGQAAQDTLRQKVQNAEWMQRLRNASQAGHLNYTLEAFTALIDSGIDSIQDVETRDVVRGLQETASRALLGSPLLNRILMGYLSRYRSQIPTS